MKKRSY
ncbi:cb58da7b-437c-49b9-9ea2-a565c88229db [Thermothielavioides terrestris]|nr:cb58da7b-437c-49b9-9ea2-a565c88229db [Thermothielavioides terrestris]